jgi:hypothetical protein
MHSNKGKPLITIGVIGAIIAVVCCFTPALVILLSGEQRIVQVTNHGRKAA